MKHIMLLTALLASPAIGAESYRPKVGEPCPNFVLPNIETGEAVSLSDYRGRKVLLIHFASW